MKKYPDYYHKKYNYCQYRYEKSFFIPPNESEEKERNNNSSLRIGNTSKLTQPIMLKSNAVNFDDVFSKDE